jgi:hypothetical protein
MRRLVELAVILSTIAVVPSALGEDAAKPSPETQPKPAVALADAFHGMAGSWACKGTFQAMDGSGKMLESKSSMVLKSALDGFAYSGDYRVEKNAMLPGGMKGQMYWTYDSANKKLVEFYADSFGSLGHGTSDGLKGDTVVWDENGVMMGKASKSRTTVKHVSANQITLTFEMQMDGKWTTLGTDTCNK